MPLIVNIVTDQGKVSLTFQKDGSVQRKNFFSFNPDTVIKADFVTLQKLHLSRDKNQFLNAEKEGRVMR